MEERSSLNNNSLQKLSDENRKKLEDLGKNIESKKDELSDLIKKYPITSVAIAAGIGFLIGKLFNSKR